MTVADCLRWLTADEQLELTAEQIRACYYLERAGLVMCVDFGYGNAIRMARAHWQQRRAACRKKVGKSLSGEPPTR